jgi:hypothetical protein
MMEKSGCINVTKEELNVLENVVKSNATELVKAAATLDRLGLSVDEAKRVLDSGEYRVVEG